MPDITVTERQHERLTAIENDLEAAYIDTYGHIRRTDVVQYLLDTYTPPEQQGDDVAYERIATADFGTLQAVATDVDGVPGSGIDAATMRGQLLSTLGAEEFATRLAAVDDGGVEPEGDTSADDDTAAEEGDTAAADDDTAAGNDGAAAEESSTASDGAADGDAAESAGPGSTPGGDGPGSILSAANQLLDDHDDKWRSGGSDEPYEVDLPDGTTETVRTKDDIRGLLFKHY